MQIRSNVVLSPVTRRMVALLDRYYPNIRELYITSGSDGVHGTNSYHYSGLAIDVGGYDDPESNDKDQRDMGLCADWLFENFWDLTLELIHTQPHNDHYTYVKNQQKVGAYASADHVNHIHWATSAALMDRIESRAQARWGSGNAPAPATGAGPGNGPGNGPGKGPYLPLPDESHYFGDINGPVESHGGHVSASPHDRGYISRIQAALGIAEDGIFGPGTVSAVIGFQVLHGLGVDGRVGRQTWDALFPTP